MKKKGSPKNGVGRSKPPFLPGKTIGGGKQKWDQEICFTKDDLQPPAGAPAEDPDMIGIYLQRIRLREVITNDCVGGGADCGNAIVSRSEVDEWTYLKWSEFGLDPANFAGDEEVCAKVWTRPGLGPEYDSNDVYRAGANGVGCSITFFAEGYLILPSHPNFNDIEARLAAMEKKWGFRNSCG